MFKGSFTALITPFRNGKLDEDAFQRFVDWQISEGTHGLVPAGTTGESPTLRLRRAQARHRADGRDGQGPGAGDRRHRLELDRRGDRAHRVCRQGRRRRGADRHALLQQADAGRALPALQGDQRRRRHPDRHLQHSRPLGRRHDRRYHDALLRVEERRRRQGRDRQPRTRLAAAPRDGAGVQLAVGRGRHRAGLHGPRRPWLHLGRLEHRAAPVRRVPERLPRRRLQDGAGAAGSPHAAA